MADRDPTDMERHAGREETQPKPTGEHSDEHTDLDRSALWPRKPTADDLDDLLVQNSSEPSKWVPCLEPDLKTRETPCALKPNTVASNPAFPGPASEAEVSTIDPGQLSERASSSQDNAPSGNAYGKESSVPLSICPNCRYQPKDRRDAQQVE